MINSIKKIKIMESGNNTQIDQDRPLSPIKAYSKNDLLNQLSLKTEEKWKSPVLALSGVDSRLEL